MFVPCASLRLVVWPTGEPLEEDCVSKNGFVLIEMRDARLHWLERVEEPHNITLLTGEPGRYGQVPAWLGFGPLC